MLNRDIVINDLREYYSDDEFKTATGFFYNEITDADLMNFFNFHCNQHKTVVTAKELYENYADGYVLINTPDGYSEIGDLVKKKPKTLYSIKTIDHHIKCSYDHMIETPIGWKYAKELNTGDLILTKDGFQEITYIRKGKTDVVYDLEVMTPNHRYWGGSGVSSHNTGKTFLALSICREAQKKGYTPIYLDSEGSIDVDFVRRIGCDPSNFVIKQVSLISEVSTFIANLCASEKALPEKDRHKIILVLDSLGNLTSDKELKTTIEGGGAKDMTKQQEIKALFRTNMTPIAQLGIPMIVNTHIYQTQDLFSKQIVSGGSGINYNSSVTIMLSVAKLDDKESDKAAENKVGEFTKTGVLVTATPKKSRFTITQKVRFQIPFFKAPNPYTGLEAYITWENSGIVRGKMIDEKEYAKLSPADQAVCYPMTDENGNPAYAFRKETSRNIVVKHLHGERPFVNLWTSEVFTDEVLRRLDEEVIKPNFELPSQETNADIDELASLENID